jgi:hypothetical protein
MAAPSKEAQVAESEARAKAGIIPNETNAALDVAEHSAPQDPGEGGAPAPQPDALPNNAKVGSRGDDMRSQIQARFRTERTTAAAEEKDEITDFTRSGGMPEDFRQFDQATGADEPQPQPEPEPAPAAPAEPAAPAQTTAPEMVEIIVRGEKKLVPMDELKAKAQIAFAADNYLEEARSRLDSVKTLENEIRAQRPAPSSVHPAAPNGTQAAEPSPSDPASTTPEDPYQKTVEAIQFGDPAEAKSLLQNTIARETEAATQRFAAQARIENDRIAAQRTLAEFSEKHPEIANDRKARAVIEEDVLEQQAADLTALKVDLSKIRQDGRPATPADIANYHQILRSQGHAVRSPGQLLEAAHDNYLKWKGETPKPAVDPTPQPAPTPQNQRPANAPRVSITVDRAARQAAPQPQPPAPRPAPQPQRQAPTDRSSVVQAMRERNAQRRGRTLGL